jgi:hypothetical protein
MSDKHNDDEYFFDDDELDSFASELDEDKPAKAEPAEEASSEEPVAVGQTVAGEYDSFVESTGEDEVEADDVSSDFADDSEPESDFMNKLKGFSTKHSRLLLVAGVGVVAVVVFSVFLGGKSDQQKLMASAPVKQAVAQPAPVVVQQAPSVSKQQLSSVTKVVANNKNGLNSLQSRIGNLSAKQADTNDAISQLSSQLQQMQSGNQQLLAQVKLLEKHEQDRLKKVAYKKTHYVHLRVQAIESGRAWLMGSNGLTQSVSVGTELPHYGKVLSIDVDNGTVVTGSGETIKYGIEKFESADAK